MASPLPRLRVTRSYEFRASEAAVAAAVGERVPSVGGARKTSTSPLSVLEVRRPDMARAITLLWGHPEMDEYFQRLWLSDGNQLPIDPDAMSELMLLAQVHRVLFPRRPERSLANIYGGDRLHESPANSGDPWAEIPPRR